MVVPQERRKEYPARIFNRATVVCPSCLQRFKEASEQCPRCGFDAYRAVEQFSFIPPVMERVMDYVEVIDEKLRADIYDAVGDLVNRFPQLGFYFCFLELNDPVRLSEFGFWMMNVCKLQEGQVERDRAWSMLILVDVKRGLVSLTPGYALEAFIEDSKWEEALCGISESLAAEDYRGATLGFLKRAGQLLCQSAAEVSRKVSRKSREG